MAGKKVVGELIASIRLQHAQLEDDMKQARKKFSKLGKDIDRIGRDISKRFGLSFTAIGAVATLAAQEMDDALDKIRISTGQTGKALDGLNKDFKAVSRGVPDSFANVAKAIGDLNARLGLTGEPLQALAKQTLTLARITGSDLGSVIQTNTRVFGDWGIKVEDTAKAQDYLFKTSQQTGITIQSLGEQIVKYGAPLRQFGFDFENAAALIGKFEKEGVNSELVFGGLRAALGKLSKAGIELRPGLDLVMAGIKNAGSAALANQAAIEVFGQKAGPDMAAAIREGRFEIGELVKNLKDSPETIMKAAEETDGFAEAMQRMVKAIKEIAAKFGQTLMDIFEPIIKVVASGLEWLSDVLDTKFGKAILNVIAVLGGLVTVAGPVILAIKGIIAVFIALIGWPALVIGAFAALYVAWKTWGDDVLAFFEDLKKNALMSLDYIQAHIFKLSQFMGYIGDLEMPWDAWAKASKDFDWAMGVLAQKWTKNAQGATEAKDATDKYTKGLTEAEQKAKNLKDEQDAAEASGMSFNEMLKKIGQGSDGAAKSLERQAKQVAKLKEEWASYQAEFAANADQNSITKGMENALEQFDKATFDRFAEQMRKSIEDETFGKLAEKYKDIIPESDLRAQAQKEAQIKADEFAEQWGDRSKEVYQEGIDFWRSTFENAITGVSFDLEDALKQVAVGFAAEIANAIFGNLSGIAGNITSPQGLGGALAQMLLGGITGGGGAGGGLAQSVLGDSIGSSIAEGLGISGGLGGLIGSFGGGAGVMLADGSIVAAGSAAASGGVASAAMPASGALGALGPWGVAGLAALAIGSQTNWFGLAGSGPTNPETIARKKFTEKLEEITGKLGGLKFFDETGAGRVVSDFKARSTMFGDFNDPNWGAQYQNKYGKNAGMFSGVGNALGAVLGIEDIPFEQIGPMLAESLGGSLEGLKALLNTVGASAQQMEDALLQAGKEGKISWLEFESSLQAVNEAMKPGLNAVGAFQQAFENLLKTGARGQIALDQLKNVAIEAKEAGLSSLQDLQAQLTASGKFTAEQIAGLMQALAQRGITSLEQLASAPERVLGGIIADMQALGVEFTDALSPLESVKQNLDAIPDNSEKNIHFNITGSVDSVVSDYVTPNVAAAQGLVAGLNGVTPFAKGGVVGGPTLFGFAGGTGLMGEAGPEAIMPLVRGPGGRLGVEAVGGAGRSVVFNIDARGAAPGVEHSIVAALEMVEERAVGRAVAEMADYMQRTGR